MGGGLIAGKDGPLIHAGGIVGGGIGKLSPRCVLRLLLRPSLLGLMVHIFEVRVASQRARIAAPIFGLKRFRALGTLATTWYYNCFRTMMHRIRKASAFQISAGLSRLHLLCGCRGAGRDHHTQTQAIGTVCSSGQPLAWPPLSRHPSEACSLPLNRYCSTTKRARESQVMWHQYSALIHQSQPA